LPRPMKTTRYWLDLLLKEGLLVLSAVGLAGTSLYLKRLPDFSASELEVLCLLWALFVAVKGLEQSAFIQHLARRLEAGRYLSLKLVVGTFVLSMIVTNDIALLAAVPLTLTLNTDRKGRLVILEALAANAGSALTPFGNPQNLFLFWYYKLTPGAFLQAIAPFSAFFLVVLVLLACCLKPKQAEQSQAVLPAVQPSAYVYGVLLVVVILVVLHVLPVAFALLVPVYAAAFDRKALKVDYGLLLTFLCFFGLSGNLKVLLEANLAHRRHTFLLAALASQVLSNVPAALLLSKFTTHWRALLWGVNVGGFGTLVASLANLIAYKLYLAHPQSRRKAAFALEFMALGALMFVLGCALYWVVVLGA